MLGKTSLLNKIKSKYILKYLLCFAYTDIDSVLKLIKYNKKLLNKLNINIKNYYKYKKTKKLEKYGFFTHFLLVYDIFIFILFFAYTITYYVKGTFNDENLKIGYNAKMKKFVDFMNKYILLSYLGFLTISIALNIIIIKSNISFNGYIKVIIHIVFSLIDITHFIFYSIKTHYTRFLVKPELKTSINKYGKKLNICSDKIWFYKFDLSLTIFIALLKTLIELIFILSLLLYFIDYLLNNNFQIFNLIKESSDISKHILKELNEININDFELPTEFENLNEKEKLELIFKKENMKKYEYDLDDNQIGIIEKINNIRKNNNIPKFNYYIRNNLPNFIINKKIEMIFFPDRYIYELSINLYII